MLHDFLLSLLGGGMVRAQGRVTYMPPSRGVQNRSQVNALEKPEFMAFREEMRNVNWLGTNVVSVLPVWIKIYGIIIFINNDPHFSGPRNIYFAYLTCY